jgi:membrane-associated phospholipid phosphatase
MPSNLEFIASIQQIRNPLLDLFFKGLNFFDTGSFFFLLIPAIWFGFSWRAGIRLFTIILLQTFTIQSLKDFFAIPRPFIEIPSLGVIQVSGYSLPSGGAASAFLFSALFITYSKSKYKWPLALSFFLLLSFSRLYLGVHYLQDVLLGWVIGFFFSFVFIFVFPLIEKLLEKASLPLLFTLSQVIPLTLTLLHPSPFILNLNTIALGLGIGTFLTCYFKLSLSTPKTNKTRFYRAMIGTTSSFTLYLGALGLQNTPLSKDVIQILLGISIPISGSILCKYLKQKN